MSESLLERVKVVKGRRSDDERGWLHVALGASQLPDGVTFGEVYVVRAEKPGARRGDHLHQKMEEWFSVIEGVANLELLDPATGERLGVLLDAKAARTVRVPAGIVHCLVNRGPGPMTVLAWASREHDPDDVFSVRSSAGR